MNSLKQLHWPLIIGMGALALIWPLMNITGMMTELGRPIGPLFIVTLISVVWLAAVVFTQVRRPLPTLIFTGLAHGVFIIVLSAVFSSAMNGDLAGPLTNSYGPVSVLSTNAIWGSIIGGAAWGIQRVRRANDSV